MKWKYILPTITAVYAAMGGICASNGDALFACLFCFYAGVGLGLTLWEWCAATPGAGGA